MAQHLVGYARCSTTGQDLQAQREGLARLGVPADRLYCDHGLTGRNVDRPGLREALAAVRAGDVLVVTKLDRLGRSVADLTAITTDLEKRGVKLSIGGAIHDPADPIGKLLFNALAMVAAFEADLVSQRTRDGLAIARSKGKLKGRQPTLTTAQANHLYRLADAGEHTAAQIGELLGITRSTVYRYLGRRRAATTTALEDGVSAGVPITA
ncbi:recombinase family protein [Arthrobacter sp. KK5.5]|uniref:recombinase family protein n=1 Tax=Arthrobacter sp. KK5.5 TaxID=3373084 RepID=UPI003EE511E7